MPNWTQSSMCSSIDNSTMWPNSVWTVDLDSVDTISYPQISLALLNHPIGSFLIRYRWATAWTDCVRWSPWWVHLDSLPVECLQTCSNRHRCRTEMSLDNREIETHHYEYQRCLIHHCNNWFICLICCLSHSYLPNLPCRIRFFSLLWSSSLIRFSNFYFDSFWFTVMIRTIWIYSYLIFYLCEWGSHNRMQINLSKFIKTRTCFRTWIDVEIEFVF